MAKQKILTIVAKREGFRRAGLAHGQTPTDHPLNAFTKDQIAALKADPMLVVTEREVEAEKPTKGGAKD